MFYCTVYATEYWLMKVNCLLLNCIYVKCLFQSLIWLKTWSLEQFHLHFFSEHTLPCRSYHWDWNFEKFGVLQKYDIRSCWGQSWYFPSWWWYDQVWRACKFTLSFLTLSRFDDLKLNIINFCIQYRKFTRKLLLILPKNCYTALQGWSQEDDPKLHYDKNFLSHMQWWTLGGREVRLPPQF